MNRRTGVATRKNALAADAPGTAEPGDPDTVGAVTRRRVCGGTDGGGGGTDGGGGGGSRRGGSDALIVFFLSPGLGADRKCLCAGVCE